MRWIRRTAAVVLSLLVLWLLLALSGWLPPIPEANRQALLVLRAQAQWPDPQGNAFREFWLHRYRFDGAERARLQAMEPDAMVAALVQREPAADPFEELPDGCRQPYGSGCATALRATAIQADPEALAAVRAMYRYDHYRNLSTPALDMPLPPVAGANRPVKVAAVRRFDAGDGPGALALLCEDAAFWRRMRASTDLLVIDMLGVAYVSSDATLFAELLAELSPESEVPPVCRDALAPLRDAEFDQCPVLRAEFALAESFDPDVAAELAGEETPSAWQRWLTRPLYNREHMLGQMAPAYAAFCGPGHAQRSAARARFPDGVPVPDHCNVLEWSFNAVGCVLAEVGSPAWAAYYDRVLDLDSRLKLVSTAIWLRGQPAGQPVPLLFDTRPLPLRENGAELVADGQASWLQVPLRQPRGGERHYRIPVGAQPPR